MIWVNNPTASVEPGGSSGELQYNNAGVFGGASLLDYLTSGNIFTISQGVAADVPVTIQYVASPTGDAFQVMDSAAKEVWAVRGQGGVIYNAGKSSTIAAGSIMYRIIAPSSFTGRYFMCEANAGADVWQMDSAGTQFWGDTQFPNLSVSGTTTFVLKGNGSMTFSLHNNTVGANLLAFDGTNVDYISGADYNADFFRSAASGETKAVKVTGFRAGDAARTLSIAVGATAANQVDFTGLSTGDYYFDGTLKFGIYTAITTEALAGYITIKDAAGNSRKLAVVA